MDIPTLEREYAAIRAGRANPAVLNKVMVDYYGVPTPILERAVSLVHDVENGIAEIAPETLRLLSE